MGSRQDNILSILRINNVPMSTREITLTLDGDCLRYRVWGHFNKNYSALKKLELYGIVKADRTKCPILWSAETGDDE